MLFVCVQIFLIDLLSTKAKVATKKLGASILGR